MLDGKKKCICFDKDIVGAWAIPALDPYIYKDNDYYYYTINVHSTVKKPQPLDDPQKLPTGLWDYTPLSINVAITSRFIAAN